MLWDILQHWLHLLGLLALVVAISVSVHPILYKRDSRSVVAWVGLIWLAPFVGAILYLVFGINRIRRRAAVLRAGRTRLKASMDHAACSATELASRLGPGRAHLAALARLGGRVLRRPLLAGNTVTPLHSGTAAYEAMLVAIHGAQSSVGLSTYIFNHDRAGRRFVEALAQAAGRGVQVRVLIDDVGARYAWPAVDGVLQKAGVEAVRFNQAFFHWKMPYFNLRNHRKILVVDGRVGFTGGMNIREECLDDADPDHHVRDLHFRLEGPVVAHLAGVFLEDWTWSTGVSPDGEVWFPPLEPRGGSVARGISAGPDEDFEKLSWMIQGALACARERIRVATPYFLPNASMISALNVAAMRGVEVDIVLPARNNLAPIHWASRAQWWQILEHGCRLWLTPGSFDHSKLMVVDDAWALFGSANWDPRSLRLNFEFDVECYDPALAEALGGILDRRMGEARQVTLEQVDGRSLPAKLRDGVARLCAPFL